jgi:predicted PurR-regulated permease PerM
MKPFDAEALAAQQKRTLALLLAASGLALGWILLPFYGTILWASIIALVFGPVHRRLRRRYRATLAALLTLLIVLVLVIVAFVLVTGALASEASRIFEQIQSGELKPERYFRGVFNALPDWGVLVIGLVDNLLRPVLVGRDTRMPDYVVMITTLGGMAVFGINGFVLGPAIAAMFFAVWHFYTAARVDAAP